MKSKKEIKSRIKTVNKEIKFLKERIVLEAGTAISYELRKELQNLHKLKDAYKWVLRKN